MSDDLNTEIRITASADGVEAGVRNAKQSIAGLSQAAEKAGEQGGKGLGKIGAGGEGAARKVEAATKNMAASLERMIAKVEAGGTATRQYQESIARMRGADMGALKPYLDQLDAAKVKAESAARAQGGLEMRLGTLGGVADVVRGQLIALAGSVTLGAMFAFVKNVNDGVDALNDIKDATGATIENISALEDVALRTGGSLDLVGSVLIKFNDVLSKATPKSDMALALESIGLKAEELRKLDPAEALRQTAVALSGYADDANKARLVQELFGKSVKDAAPFLADLAEKGALLAKVTTAQTAEAEKFNKQLFDLKTTAGEAGRALVSDMLPGLNQITTAMAKGAKEGGLLLGVYRGIAEFGSIALGTDELGSAMRDANAAQAEMVRLQSVMLGVQNTLERDPGNAAAQRRLDGLRAQLEGVQKQALSATSALKGLLGSPAVGDVPPVETTKPSVTPPKSAAEIGAAASAAKKGAEDLRRELAEQAKLVAELHGLSGSFAEDWARLSKVYTDKSGVVNMEALAAAQAKLLEKQPAIKAAADAEKKMLEELAKASQLVADARNKEVDGITAWFQQQQAAAEQSLRSVTDRVAALQTEEAAVTLATSLNISLAEAIERVAIERMREKQAGFIEGSEGWQAIEREIAARKELLGLVSSKAQREDEARGWADMWQSVDRTAHDVFVNVLEGGQDAFKRLGNTLKASVLDVLYQMTVRKWIINIGTSVFGAGFGAAASAATGGGAGGALSTIGGIGSGFSMLSGLGAFGGGLAGGFGGLMGSLGLSATGSTLGGALSASSIALQSGNIMGGLGTIAGALGPIAIGIALLSSFIKKSTPHMGAASSYSAAGGLQSGADVYSASGFSDVRTYSAQAEAVTAPIARSLAMALDLTASTFGRKAGYEISTAFADDKSKDGAWGSLVISRDGQKLVDWRDTQTSRHAPREFADGEAGQKEYMTAIARDARDALKEAIGDVGWATGMLDALGDSPALEGLTQVVDQINAAKAAFVSFGQYMPVFSGLAESAISALAAASGGVGALTGNMSVFVDNFYTDAEKLAINTQNVSASMAELGFAMPATREEFRALVQAQIALGDAGAEAAAELLGLSGAFASVTQSAEQAAAMARASADTARGTALSALQRAVDAEKRMLSARLTAAREVSGSLESIFGTLRDNVRELYGEVASTAAMQAAQGQAFISNALDVARTTGYLPDPDQLAEAIGAARSGLDADTFTGDSAERDYAALVLAGKLSGLEALTEKQLTDARRTVNELEHQTEQLDQTLEYWRQQIDIATGTFEGVLSVAAAVDRLSATLAPPTAGASGPGGGGGGGGDVGGPGYRDRGMVPRAAYGADEALTSFDKFKAWYQGLATNANTSELQSSGYQVPDWMRVGGNAGDSTDKELFGSYLYFRNNPQFAQDFEQVMTTGRSSMPTDGSTLVRSDLSKMPTDAADYFKGDRNSLLSYEAFGLDPVLAYRLYKDGPAQFGLDIKRENFTEWLRTHKWTDSGIVQANNTLDTARPYSGYKLPRWDTSTGNIVDLDGSIYTADGRYLGSASRSQMETIYGSAFVGTSGSNYGDATRSALYNSQVHGGDSEAAYYAAIKGNLDAAIAGGMSAQGIADAITQTGASMQDVAAAYGITVAQLEENLRSGGATNIPKFAVGTNYLPRDTLAYLHEGEAVVPKAYNPAANGAAGGGNAELVAEVRALRQEVAALRAAGEATADNTGRSAGVLVAVQRGNSLSQVAEPTF